MNTVVRAFAMSGVAIAAGLAVSAGPAAASPAAPQPGAKAPAAAQADAKARFRDRIVGFYRSPGACHQAGRYGEWRDRWEDHDCFPVRNGFRRSSWALKVYYGWSGPRGGSHDFHDGPDHGHGPWKKN